MNKISEYIVKYVVNITASYKNKFLFDGNKIGHHRGIGWGFSTEFSEYRPYIEGEDIRFLDWKHYALTGRKYVKVFTRETNTSVSILLDTSSSMSFYKNKDDIPLASLITGVLSYIFYRLGDRVNVYFFNDEIIKTFDIKNDFMRLKELWGVLDRLSFYGKTNIGKVVKNVSSQLPYRGYVVLISDFYTDVEELSFCLNYLIPSTFFVFSIFVKDEKEIDVGNGNVKVVGLEGGSVEIDGWEYKKMAERIRKDKIREIMGVLEKKGIRVYEISPETEIREFLHYLIPDII